MTKQELQRHAGADCSRGVAQSRTGRYGGSAACAAHRGAAALSGSGRCRRDHRAIHTLNTPAAW